MLNIRIKEFYEEEGSRQVNLKCNIQDKSIIGLSGGLVEPVIQAITGRCSFSGDIVLDYISLKAEKERFIDCIRVLNNRRRKILEGNNLTVQEYLNFMELLYNKEGAYFQFEKSVGSTNIGSYKLCELDRQSRLLLEFFASLLTRSKILILENYLELFEQSSYLEVIKLLNLYIEHGNICLLVSEDKRILKKVSCKIYQFV